MSKNPDNKLTAEQQAQVCALLETYGYIVDKDALADYLGCTPKALDYFLRTNTVKEAKARYLPGTREAAKKNLTDTDRTHEELAFPDKMPEGYHVIDVIPPNVIGAFALHSARRA